MPSCAVSCVSESEEGPVRLSHQSQENEDHCGDESTDDRAIDVFPVEYSFGEVGLDDLLEDVGGNQEPDDVEGFPLLRVQDRQREEDLHDDAVEVAHAVGDP